MIAPVQQKQPEPDRIQPHYIVGVDPYDGEAEYVVHTTTPRFVARFELLEDPEDGQPLDYWFEGVAFYDIDWQDPAPDPDSDDMIYLEEAVYAVRVARHMTIRELLGEAEDEANSDLDDH